MSLTWVVCTLPLQSLALLAQCSAGDDKWVYGGVNFSSFDPVGVLSVIEPPPLSVST